MTDMKVMEVDTRAWIRSAQGSNQLTVFRLRGSRLPTAVFIIQLIALVVLSLVQWEHRALTSDFAFYSQMYWSIGHGHLDPYSSLFGFPAIRDNLELIMWPLGLLEPLSPSPLTLLLIQDLSLSAAGLVAFRWVAGVLEAQSGLTPRARTRIFWTMAAAVLFDPWCYVTSLFDFHTAALAGFFTIAAAKDLHEGRSKRAWVWILLLLTTGPVGMLAAAGLGGAGLLLGGRTGWRRSLCLMVASAGLLLIASAVGLTGVDGRNFRDSYSYLNPGSSGSILGDATGLFVHAGAVGHLFARHLGTALLFLLPVGIIGVLSKRAGPAVAAVFLPPMLAADPRFFRLEAAFQIWAVLPLVLVASVEATSGGLVRLSAKTSPIRTSAKHLALVYVPLAAAVCTPMLLVRTLSTQVPQWISVSSAAGRSISQIEARLSPDTEVVAPNGIIGSFGTRRWIYQLDRVGQEFPVHSHTVVFLYAPDQGVPTGVSAEAQRALSTNASRLPRARAISWPGGVTEVVWRPPLRASTFSVPPGPDTT